MQSENKETIGYKMYEVVRARPAKRKKGVSDIYTKKEPFVDVFDDVKAAIAATGISEFLVKNSHITDLQEIIIKGDETNNYKDTKERREVYGLIGEVNNEQYGEKKVVFEPSKIIPQADDPMNAIRERLKPKFHLGGPKSKPISIHKAIVVPRKSAKEANPTVHILSAGDFIFQFKNNTDLEIQTGISSADASLAKKVIEKEVLIDENNKENGTEWVKSIRRKFEIARGKFKDQIIVLVDPKTD